MLNKQSYHLWGQLRDFIIDNKDNFPDDEKQELEKIMQIVNYNFDISRRKHMLDFYRKPNNWLNEGVNK